MQHYFYLHGLASGPASAKAKYLRDRFRSRGRTLTIPDFNQSDFAHLTLTRQIEQVEGLIAQTSKSEPGQNPDQKSPQKNVLIGSSLGGLTAAWVAERQPSVERLVLLGPAFEFLPAWLKAVGPRQAQVWETSGQIPIYHHTYQRMEALDYGMVRDLGRYGDRELQRSLPTLILHGQSDSVIPIEASRRYAQARPWVELIELDSDHSLGNSVSRIWQEIQRFCALPAAGAAEPG